MLLISRQFVSRASGWELNNNNIINNKSIYLSTTGYHCTSSVSQCHDQVRGTRVSVYCSVYTCTHVHVYEGTPGYT